MQLTFPADGARLERLRSEAHRVLAGNWRHGSLADGTPYGFTCPAPPRYRHQWYWDSCFHAIVWRHLDPARAREELRTLLRGGRLDGFIPHTIFWHDNAGWRRAPFYATHSVRGNRATAHIQTPFLAVAWELVAAASEDEPGFAAEGLDALRLHYDWLDRHRDPDGDGLISIIHPDESGLDDSPKYDAVFGWMTHYRPGYFWLVERSRRLRYDSHAIIARYDEHVEDVLVNVVYALSLRAHGQADRRRRVPPARRAHRARAARALLGRGARSVLGRRRARPRPAARLDLVLARPAGTAVTPREDRPAAIEEHLLDPRRFGAPFAIPSVSM